MLATHRTVVPQLRMPDVLPLFSLDVDGAQRKFCFSEAGVAQYSD
jgi:hypothetical protein